MEELRYYKYIHIIWPADLKFVPKAVAMINDPNAGFNVDEHLFVTRHKIVSDFLKDYPNILLDVSGDNLFNKYGPWCSFIISHSGCDLRTLLTAKRKYTKKTVWRNFGGNRTIQTIEGPFHKRIGIWLKNCLTKVWFNFRFNRFAAIGISNLVDQVDIRKINKKIPLVNINYSRGSKEYFDTDLVTKKDNNAYTNILVGHRGTPGEHHRKVLSLLERFLDKPIRIYLILSYGDDDYIRQLKSDLASRSNDRIVLIEQMMSPREYYHFLASMDLIMIDEVRSSALGCIRRALRLRKKIFLNRRGIIKETFDMDHIPHALIDDIPEMSFEELVAPVEYSEDPDQLRHWICDDPYAATVAGWHKLLDFADTFASNEN